MRLSVLALLLVALAGCRYLPGYDEKAAEIRREARSLGRIERVGVSLEPDGRPLAGLPIAQQGLYGSAEELVIVSTDPHTLTTCTKAFRGVTKTDRQRLDRSGVIDLTDDEGRSARTVINHHTVEQDFGPDMQFCFLEILRTGTYSAQR